MIALTWSFEVFQSFQSVQKLSAILVNFAKLEYLVPNLTFTSKSAEVLSTHILRIQDRLYFHVISTYIILWSLMDCETSIV